jgi:hypothetical protein
MKKRELRERIEELLGDFKEVNERRMYWAAENERLGKRIAALEAFIARGGPLPEPPLGTSSWREPPMVYTRYYDGGNP